MDEGFKCVVTCTKDWSDEETQSRMESLLDSLEKLGVKGTIRVSCDGETIFNRSTTRTILGDE